MGKLTDLASTLAPNLTQRNGSVIVFELDKNDVPTGAGRNFQYFPDSIRDNKAVNYITKDIPGGSLPIYQWVSSGARIISFTAIFTTDVDLSIIPGLVNRVAGVGQANRNVDIKAAVTWLRRFVLPLYSSQSSQVSTPLTFAPNKLWINIPGSGIGLAGGYSGTLDDDSFIAIMTQCDVTWDSYFPSGWPRQATVQLSFAQVPQYQGVVTFPQANTIMENAVNGKRSTYFGYKLIMKNISNPGSGSGGA